MQGDWITLTRTSRLLFLMRELGLVSWKTDHEVMLKFTHEYSNGIKHN